MSDDYAGPGVPTFGPPQRPVNAMSGREERLSDEELAKLIKVTLGHAQSGFVNASVHLRAFRELAALRAETARLREVIKEIGTDCWTPVTYMQDINGNMAEARCGACPGCTAEIILATTPVAEPDQEMSDGI